MIACNLNPYNTSTIFQTASMTTQKCAFHPTETLTNFCRNPSCLLPMCPSCIKVHSLQHMR